MSLSSQLKITLLALLLKNAFADEVCYDVEGCFNDDLLCHKLVKPERSNQINTEFYLYRKENANREPSYEILDIYKDDSIINSNFRSDRDTKILIHGWNGRSIDEPFRKMRDALLSLPDDLNVIIVRWGEELDLDLADLLNYIRDAGSDYLKDRQNTRLVGRQIAILTERLNELKGAPYASMHLIGHSLGAQIAGYAGTDSAGRYRRITGLDPAGPLFEEFFLLRNCFLDKTDADLVDIIHTDGLLGFDFAVGDQDFYPNGGRYQTGCFNFAPCDHMRAVVYFTESITGGPNCFRSKRWCTWFQQLWRRCPNENPSMGYFADQSQARGIFYLDTPGSAPFCR